MTMFYTLRKVETVVIAAPLSTAAFVWGLYMMSVAQQSAAILWTIDFWLGFALYLRGILELARLSIFYDIKYKEVHDGH